MSATAIEAARDVGTRMGRCNLSPPIWLEPLLEQAPACMTKREWAEYVDGVRREASINPTMRKRLERGQGADYCDVCTLEYRERMRAQGRCRAG